VNETIRELARLIEEASGFVIANGRLDALEDLVRERMAGVGSSDIEGYVRSLRHHGDSDELRRLLGLITIKESYLFRGRAQFDALQETVLSELLARRRDRRLRVWCAGCARGEEAATLAIVLADHEVVGDWRWSILATDVDEAALAEAETGLFGPRAVARVPEDCLQRHFTSHGDRFELDPELRARIEFRRVNLADRSLELGGENFDLIFLRNVLIYFRLEVQRRVVAAVEGVLADGGSLFLAPSESLLHLDTGLQARELGGSFCYRHRETAAGGDPADARRKRPPATAEATTDMVSPPVQREASEEPGLASSENEGPTIEARIEQVIGRLEKDDLHGALDLIDDMRTGFPENAVAHALEGIARERTGDLDAAVLAYRGALYLKPAMDEVRFLLARCLRLLGRVAPAAREYRAVLIGLGSPSSRRATLVGRLGLPPADEMIDECRSNS
jgi:chemotaxis protein methyltransferase CheR